MRFVRSRYQNVVLLLRGDQGYSSFEIPVEIGTKQGCPESPTDFNVYINDLIVYLAGNGVTVNGSRDEIVGLLFADDLVIISPTRAFLYFQNIYFNQQTMLTFSYDARLSF